MSQENECICECGKECCVDVGLPPVKMCFKFGEKRESEPAARAFSLAPMTSDSGINYSLQEQWTGKYWITGKKIYQKTVEIGSLGSLASGVERDVNHSIANIEDIVRFDGFAAQKFSSEAKVMPLPHPYYGTSNAVCVVAYDTQVTIYPSAEFHKTFTRVYVTIQYTCKDR